MPKIDIANAPVRTGSIYPPPHDAEMEGRSSLRLGDAGGLTQFGANLVTLKPGAKSSLRHWHVHEDEFLMVTHGTATLIDDMGETPLQCGDFAAFPAGDENGHCIANKSGSEVQFLVIGSRAQEETAYYSDLDMMVRISSGSAEFTHKNGQPYVAVDPAAQ